MTVAAALWPFTDFPGLLLRHGSLSQAWDRLDSAIRLEILTGATTAADGLTGQDTSWGLLNPEFPDMTQKRERGKVTICRDL